ncbi:MAG: anti-sigma factor [Planctomycetota bacterium]|jgi:hypothetical protein
MKEESDMDAYAGDERIDELLNGFIDDELSIRQRTEVERLIAHDVKIEQRLLQLQKCRILVGSLPCAEAPPQMLEGIKASLAGTSVVRFEEEPVYDHHAGRIHLLARKMLSAAAMLALVGILAGVIYTIVAPETVPDQPVIVADRQPLVDTSMLERVSDASAALAFSGRLELKTSDLAAVGTIINRAIEENALSDSIGDVREANKRIHYVKCSRAGLNSLLADLEDIWPRLDSATMLIGTEVFDTQVAINAVTTEQIVTIVDQDSSEDRLELARDFNLLNSAAERLPGEEIVKAIEGEGPNLTAIPRYMMTGGELANAKSASETQADKTIRLTIVVSR